MNQSNQSAEKILESEYLLVRAKLIEVAAVFDRIERAEGSVADHPMSRKLLQAIEVLRETSSQDKAEQIQALMSRQYDPKWPETMQIQLGDSCPTHES